MKMANSIDVKDIIAIAKKNENKLSKNGLIDFLFEFCEENNIKMIKEYDNDSVRRIILSNDIINAGTVIDVNTWKVLAMPPPQPNSKFSRKTLKLSNYEVAKIIDGTIVTLYYFEDAWNISTVNGYDVSNITWIGSKTFAQLLYDALSENKNLVESSGLSLDKDDGRLNFTNLSTDYYYTIGFRHENIHPPHNKMRCPRRVAWFVNSNVPDIDKSPMQYLPTQSIVNIELIKNIDELFLKSPSDYGYILRNKKETLLVESELTKTIKKWVYTIPKIGELNSSNRLLFVIVRAYLSDYKDKFLIMFPQFAQEYKKCEIIYRSICGAISNIASHKDISPAYAEITELIYNKMRKIDAINLNKQNWSIIKHYVGPEYTLLFMNLYDIKFDQMKE